MGSIASFFGMISDLITSYLFKEQEPARTTRIEARVDSGEAAITMEELMKDAEVTDLLSRYKKQTTLLRPHKSDEESDFGKSKMGGVPNLNGFQEWPVCDECNTPLDFVLQLYRTDFPDFYFPDNENIFQLFRCPNGCCPAAYSGDHYDHKMFHYYWNVNTDENNDIEIPDSMKSRSLGEEKAQECHFRPKISDDYPDPGDYAGDDWANLEDKYGGDMLEEDRVVTFTDKGLYLFMDTFYVKRATKCGGYPSWTQDTKWPDCGCGSKKEFFFQLAGDEDHGLFLGDGGSINYFVCTKCGEESIESRSDCT